MKKLAILILAFCAAAGWGETTCERLKSVRLSGGTIVLTQPIAAGAFKPAGDLPSFCRVVARLTPGPDSDIGMELWLPEANWNGKFEAVGNGGWQGSISTSQMAAGLRRGYAVASTDTGHEGAAGLWMQHPEKLADFGYRAVHETAVASKSLVRSYYGNEAKLSYMNGCSAGGRQGLKAAQKYPADFDGIVAGAPALNTTGRASFSIWIAQNVHKDEASYIPPSKYAVIHNAVLRACDALDGVRDGVIEDPRRCKFEPETLQCKDGDSADCLTAAQVQSARTIYSALINPRTKMKISPGLESGSEMGWATFGGPQPFGLGDGMFKYMGFKNSDWDYKTLNFDADMALTEKIENGAINATDPNLNPFFQRGGKLIQYHGWADPQIPPGYSVDYYQSVLARLGGAQKVSSNYRLFMVPGMAHCGGGDGPSSFDMLAVLENWVEKGQAPDQVPAAHLVNGRPDRTRILCPYPQVATYKGNGDPNDAANFLCK